MMFYEWLLISCFQELGIGVGLKIVNGDEYIVNKAKGHLRAVLERNWTGPEKCKEVSSIRRMPVMGMRGM